MLAAAFFFGVDFFAAGFFVSDFFAAAFFTEAFFALAVAVFFTVFRVAGLAVAFFVLLFLATDFLAAGLVALFVFLAAVFVVDFLVAALGDGFLLVDFLADGLAVVVFWALAGALRTDADFVEEVFAVFFEVVTFEATFFTADLTRVLAAAFSFVTLLMFPGASMVMAVR